MLKRAAAITNMHRFVVVFGGMAGVFGPPVDGEGGGASRPVRKRQSYQLVVQYHAGNLERGLSVSQVQRVSEPMTAEDTNV